jgi:hypothetical protein
MFQAILACFVVSTMALENASDVESITELADILTNPFHDDNAKPVKKIHRYICEIVSETRIVSDQIREDYTKESTAEHQTPNTKHQNQAAVTNMCQHQVIIGACGHITYSFVERVCVQALYSHSSARNMFPASHYLTTHTIRTPRYCHGCGPAPSQNHHDHGKCTVNSLSAQLAALSIVPRR